MGEPDTSVSFAVERQCQANAFTNEDLEKHDAAPRQ